MNMNFKANKTLNGFSLIEVMIALIVLAVGILGISKLQGTLIRSASDANQRTVAVSLAQQKIDDLRSFVLLKADVNGDGTDDAWTSAATWPENQQSFAFIADDEGGKIAPADSLTPIVIGNYAYTLTWDVEDYYFPAALSVASVVTGTIPTRFKEVTVRVGWTDEGGDTQTLLMNTVIDAYSPLKSAAEPVTYGSDSPKIPYTPQAAPDVIPVTLRTDDGLKKETSKPLPDVSKKGFSTVVQFESVTYNDTLDTVKREEFRTVVCRCGNGSSPNNEFPVVGKTIWDAENSKLADVAEAASTAVPTITKTDVDDGGGETQAAECSTCCRDGADVPSSVFKACRLKRVDGVLRIFEPWKMIAFNLIPAPFFNASAAGMTLAKAEANIDEYSDYVVSLVRARTESEAIFDAAQPDTSFVPAGGFGALGTDSVDHQALTVGSSNKRQLQARAVYMDYPPVGIYTNCASCAVSSMPWDVVPLDRIPFFEVNVTNLAGWMPDRNNITFVDDYPSQHDDVGNPSACLPDTAPSRNYVTNDEIKNDCETTLSRGMFYPISATAPASTAIQTIMYTSNDGVVNQLVNPMPPVSTATATIDLIVNP